MSEWRNFGSRGGLDRALAQHIADRLRAAIATRGRASLAVSGGGTPKPMFRELSRCELDWTRVWITLVDERWVNPDHADSNEALVRRNLLQGAAAEANFIGLTSDHQDAREGLAEVAVKLARLRRPFDVVVLGMGSDGHTASWFPRADNLQQLLDPSAQETVAVTNPVTAAHQRITLTFAAVVASLEIIVHITGESKKSVMESAVSERYPIAAILEQKQTPVTIWWAP